MLVLTRKHGQGIRIDEDIEVSVLEVCGKRVRLGITAPKDIPIHRPESPCHSSIAEADTVPSTAIHRTAK